MAFPERAIVDQWKQEWTDRIVRVKATAPASLIRFAGKLGRVVTINYSGRAIVDFADGAWYDVPNFAEVFEIVSDASDQNAFDRTANSAQALPPRQN
jgi:hypothetical protein